MNGGTFVQTTFQDDVKVLTSTNVILARMWVVRNNSIMVGVCTRLTTGGAYGSPGIAQKTGYTLTKILPLKNVERTS